MTLKFPLESVIFIILSIIIVRDSLVGDLYGTTGFNLLIFLLSSYLLLFTMKFSKLIIFMFLFISSLMLSTLINHNAIEQGGYNTLVFFIVSLFLLSSIFKTIDNTQRLFKYIIFSTILFLVVIYFFYLFNFQLIPMRISYVLAGPYLNQNSTSMILLALMTLLVVLNKSTKISHLFIFMLFISIILTQARSALIAGVILLMYYYRKKLMIIIPLGLIGLFAFFSIYDKIYNRIYFKITEGGSSHRIEFWTYTISNISNDFIAFFFGNGINSTSINLLGRKLSVHSSYVNFFANYGFVSIILLVILLTYIIYDAQKYSQLLAIGLLALLIHGLFETVLFSGFSITWMTFILLYAMRKQLTKGQTCTY